MNTLLVIVPHPSLLLRSALHLLSLSLHSTVPVSSPRSWGKPIGNAASAAILTVTSYSNCMNILSQTSALRCYRRNPSFHLPRYISQAPDVLPIPPLLKSVDTPEDKLSARTWIAEFKKLAIPKRLVEFTFARSSGPGGQVCSSTHVYWCLLTRSLRMSTK